MYWLAFIASWIFCIANQGWTSWILLSAVVFFPWVSLLLSLPAMLSLKPVLQAPRQVTLGTPAVADWPQPPTLPVKAVFTLRNLLTGEERLLRPGEALPTEHCCALQIVPKRIFCCDILGLFRRRLRRAAPVTVFVLPQPKKHAPPAGLEQYLSTAWRPKPGGGYSEQHELREYQPGDNLNQIHWKLSAKTGDLIIREPMEPIRSKILLTLDLAGLPQELDEKLGRLLWLGQYMLEQEISFEILAHTGNGRWGCAVSSHRELIRGLEELLSMPQATEGSITAQNLHAGWMHHIGGAAYET